MNYIVFDLEFNQDFSSLQNFESHNNRYPFEVIQIGAVKLDRSFNTISTFNRYVKPYFYGHVCPFITTLTGITTQQLLAEEAFPEVYSAFMDFIGHTDAVFCTWGMSDMKELFRNADYHKLDHKLLPHLFINIQPLVSIHLGLPAKRLLRLEHAVASLQISTDQGFHNAFYDAYYTAEILKKIYHPSIQPTTYDPTYVSKRPIQQKKQIDTEALMSQFTKMYARDLTKEEQTMILLAYKMGKTQQFLI